MTRDPLSHRNRALVAAILTEVYEDPEPIPWTDVVHAYTSDQHLPRTVEGTLYDLIGFGAITRIGKPATRTTEDTRAIRQTALGRAWWTGEDPPERPTP